MARLGSVIAALLAFGACVLEVRDLSAPAVYCVDDGARCLEVSLAPDEQHGHSRLSRQLVITQDGKRAFSEQLASRWARAVRMNLYLAGQDRLIVRECEYSVVTYEIDLASGQLNVLRHGVPPDVNLTFVGAFDADSSSKWRFISVSERPELRLPEPER